MCMNKRALEMQIQIMMGIQRREMLKEFQYLLLKSKASCFCNDNEKLKKYTTHMLHNPIVVCQSHELDQLEMIDNCFCVENQISLVQASQTPVKTI